MSEAKKTNNIAPKEAPDSSGDRRNLASSPEDRAKAILKENEKIQRETDEQFERIRGGYKPRRRFRI
jgi:hypothetical protein